MDKSPESKPVVMESAEALRESTGEAPNHIRESGDENHDDLADSVVGHEGSNSGKHETDSDSTGSRSTIKDVDFRSQVEDSTKDAQLTKPHILETPTQKQA